MWTALPSSEYYGASAPSRGLKPAVDLPAISAGCGGRGGRPRDGSHVHRQPIGGGGAQLYPCSLAPGQPQPSPGPPSREPLARPGDGRHDLRRSKHCLGPHPSGSSRLRVKGRPTLVRLLHLPASLAGPGRLMVPARPYVVRAAPTRSPYPRGDSRMVSSSSRGAAARDAISDHPVAPNFAVGRIGRDRSRTTRPVRAIPSRRRRRGLRSSLGYDPETESARMPSQEAAPPR